jgi:hypothetical protein
MLDSDHPEMCGHQDNYDIVDADFLLNVVASIIEGSRLTDYLRDGVICIPITKVIPVVQKAFNFCNGSELFLSFMLQLESMQVEQLSNINFNNLSEAFITFDDLLHGINHVWTNTKLLIKQTYAAVKLQSLWRGYNARIVSNCL